MIGTTVLVSTPTYALQLAEVYRWVLTPNPCRCGRTTVRMRRVSGRTDDMLIVRGVNVFPSQIESVIFAIDGVRPVYQLIVKRKGYLDELEVQVEVAAELVDSQELAGYIRRRLHTVLGINARVSLLGANSIERLPGKARRVIDKRPK